jgi:hypothetical protein
MAGLDSALTELRFLPEAKEIIQVIQAPLGILGVQRIDGYVISATAQGALQMPEFLEQIGIHLNPILYVRGLLFESELRDLHLNTPITQLTVQLPMLRIAHPSRNQATASPKYAAMKFFIYLTPSSGYPCI